MVYRDYSKLLTLPGMFENIFSVGGLVSALLLFLIVLLILRLGFYRPAHKTQVPEVRLSAILSVSAFNLIVVFPFTILFAKPLDLYLLGLWWFCAWYPFVFGSFFFFVLTVGFIVLRKWENFPAAEERPVRSFLILSVGFEILYVMACPFLTFAGLTIFGALNPDIFNIPL